VSDVQEHLAKMLRIVDIQKITARNIEKGVGPHPDARGRRTVLPLGR